MIGDSSQRESLREDQARKVLFANRTDTTNLSTFLYLRGSSYIASLNWIFVSKPKPGGANKKVHARICFTLGSGLSPEKVCKRNC